MLLFMAARCRVKSAPDFPVKIRPHPLCLLMPHGHLTTRHHMTFQRLARLYRGCGIARRRGDSVAACTLASIQRKWRRGNIVRASAPCAFSVSHVSLVESSAATAPTSLAPAQGGICIVHHYQKSDLQGYLNTQNTIATPHHKLPLMTRLY